MKKLALVMLAICCLASCSITKGLDSSTVTATAYVAPDLMFDTDEVSGCLNPALQFGLIGNIMFEKVGLHYNFAGFLPFAKLFSETESGGKYLREQFDSLWGSTVGIGLAIKLPVTPKAKKREILLSPLFEMITSESAIGILRHGVVSFGLGMDYGSKTYLKDDIFYGFNCTLSVHFAQIHSARIGSISTTTSKNEVMLRFVPRIYIGFDL